MIAFPTLLAGFQGYFLVFLSSVLASAPALLRIIFVAVVDPDSSTTLLSPKHPVTANSSLSISKIVMTL